MSSLLPIAPKGVLQADPTGKIASENRVSQFSFHGEQHRTQPPASVILPPIFPSRNCYG